jgi:hypothetical protein
VNTVLDAYLRSMSEDRDDIAGDANRWGSGEVVITDVAVLDRHGQRVTTAAAGSEIAVRVVWSLRRPVDALVVGLGLWAADGTHLWGANTGDAGIDLDLSSGSGTVTMRVPKLGLQPGPFRIDATTHDPSGIHSYDYRSEVLRLTVVPGEGVRESGGYVSLFPEWFVESGGA